VIRSPSPEAVVRLITPGESRHVAQTTVKVAKSGRLYLNTLGCKGVHRQPQQPVSLEGKSINVDGTTAFAAVASTGCNDRLPPLYALEVEPGAHWQTTRTETPYNPHPPTRVACSAFKQVSSRLRRCWERLVSWHSRRGAVDAISVGETVQT
jgi:hypothetical protein